MYQSGMASAEPSGKISSPATTAATRKAIARDRYDHDRSPSSTTYATAIIAIRTAVK